MLKLTDAEINALIGEPSDLFCPDWKGIKKGDKLLLWVKIGGEQVLSSVTVSREPYRTGPKAIYCDVFGYGVRKSVNVKKLRRLKDANS